MRLLLLALTLSAISCASKQMVSTNTVEAPEPKAYNALIYKNSFKANEYSGFHQTFQADVTMLNSQVSDAVIRQRAAYYQWDNATFAQEREKALQEASSTAKFFVRFFAPDRSYDDLHKKDSIWRFYLEVGGTRYPGKVEKMKEKLVEVHAIFPVMDRFSTAYMVTFPIPMNTAEKASSHFIMSSSLGSAEHIFPGLQ